MKLLCVSSRFLKLPVEYERYVLEYQCGSGHVITVSSEDQNSDSNSSPIIRLPVITTSPSVTQLQMTLYYHPQRQDGDGEGEVEGEDKGEDDHLILYGSKTVKLKDINDLQTLEIKIDKTTNGELSSSPSPSSPSSITSQLSYEFISSSSCIEFLEFFSTGITINTMVNFIGIPREDVSLRILNEKGSCLALSTMKQSQSSSYFTFHSNLTNLEISIASKSTGVIQMPFDLQTPMVLKLEGYPTGYILLCLNCTTGHLKKKRASAVGSTGATENTRTLLLDTISYQPASTSVRPLASAPKDHPPVHDTADASPPADASTDPPSESTPVASKQSKLSSPPKKQESKEQEDSPPHMSLPSNLIFHLQNMLLAGEEETPPNPTLLSSGILYGPLISRLEIPKFSSSYLSNSFYSLPPDDPLSGQLTSEEKEKQGSHHRLPTDLHGIMITENEFLTTKLKFRLSFLRTHQIAPTSSSLATASSVDSGIPEGPCGVYLASGILREIDRTSHSLPESIKHLPHPSSSSSSSSTSVKCLYSCYLEGTLDHIAEDIPDNFFQVGEKITCHVAIYSASIPPITASQELLEEEENAAEFLPSVSVLSHLSTSAEMVTDNDSATLSLFPHLNETPTDPHSNLVSNQLTSQRRKSSSVNGGGGGAGAGAGAEVIQVLSNQLNEKQRIIERLLDEGAVKAEVS
jgi:hypothetical protein